MIGSGDTLVWFDCHGHGSSYDIIQKATIINRLLSFFFLILYIYIARRTGSPNACIYQQQYMKKSVFPFFDLLFFSMTNGANAATLFLRFYFGGRLCSLRLAYNHTVGSAVLHYINQAGRHVMGLECCMGRIEGVTDDKGSGPPLGPR